MSAASGMGCWGEYTPPVIHFYFVNMYIFSFKLYYWTNFKLVLRNIVLGVQTR